MLNSIRGRLWLSNLILILTVFLFLAGGLVLVFINSPLSYRQTTLRVKLVESNLVERITASGVQAPGKIIDLLKAEARRSSQMRFVLVSAGQEILFDSGKNSSTSFTGVRFNLDPLIEDDFRLFTLRDAQNVRWLYTAAPLDNGLYLVTLTPRPILLITNLLRDDIFTALIRAILISLVVALGLSLATARWIARPLQTLANGVRDLSKGEFRSLPLEGPKEVKELAQSYNEMSRTVRENQQAQRDFIANVSHELKTPLTSIQGFSQSILDGAVQQPDALKNSARIIFSEAQRMNRLVLDLLTLTKLESGITDLKPGRVDLVEILAGLAEKFQLQASGAGVTITLEAPQAIQTTADGDRLAQVFGNLLDNAIKFNHPGGRVVVKAAANGGKAVIEVIDNGAGIPEEDRTRIFERFYQVEKSRRGGAGHGSGLGLSIVQQTVRAHGGDIRVESVIEKGTRFIVELPLNSTKFEINKENHTP